MFKYVLKRLVMMIPVLIGVSLVIFTMVFLTPGDAAEMILGDLGTPEDKALLREELKLDEPYLVRYIDYIKDLVLEGDLGTSYTTKRPVLNEILERFPTTVQLAGMSVILASVIGIVAGIISATKQYSIFDNIATAVSLFGVSMPNFWTGLMLILIFSVHLELLPSSGFHAPRYWILPVVTLGASNAASIMRMTRSSMLEVIRQDYIRTARAKGQIERVVIMKHALKNASIPILTTMGLTFSKMLGGAVLTESIFAIAGIGKLMVDAIKLRNTPVVQGGVIFIAFAVSIVNLVIDIICAYIDPRIKSQYVSGKPKKKKQAKEGVSANG
ncbi:MAG: ABC transporter permease [Tissierellia bacterium]|jgi:peptide/nickel transport system permease protein|nr:ABC transporter permease [Tissierellia bacterium]